MKTTITPTTYGLSYWASLARKTRSFGACYIHADARASIATPWSFEIDGITFDFCGWGRSLEGGGHKFKVHASRNGKPVPSAELAKL